MVSHGLAGNKTYGSPYGQLLLPQTCAFIAGGLWLGWRRLGPARGGVELEVLKVSGCTAGAARSSLHRVTFSNHGLRVRPATLPGPGQSATALSPLAARRAGPAGPPDSGWPHDHPQPAVPGRPHNVRTPDPWGSTA